MPSTCTGVEALLDRLESCCADDLESQDLDFKEWDTRNLSQSVRTVVSAAVCMANGGGGTVVFGVAEKLVGRDSAILGVPPEVSVKRLRVAVYDSTDPKLTPVFQERCTSTPGLPPYTDTGGRSTSRAIPVRGSAGWWGVTEMYALYICRYISGRNVSRSVFRKTFPRKMCQASCQECDRNALHSIRRSFSGRNATLRAPGPGFRLISASGSRKMSQNTLFRSFSDRFLAPIPGGAP